MRIVVPFAPGGTSDSLARLLGQKLGEMWGQTVIVENKAGADGNLGADHVARSAADGYTLMLLDIGTLTMGRVFYAKLPFDPLKDFAPVMLIQFSPHVLAVTPTLPAGNVAEILAYGKANPGKLNFAASNNSARLAGAQLQQVTGMDMLQIPYKGAGAAIMAVIAGESNIMFNSVFVTSPHIKSGKVKAIGVASASRSASLPELPALAEMGVPNFVTGSWQGLLAPAGTPTDITARINADVGKVPAMPEIRARLMEQGADIVGGPGTRLEMLLKTQSQSFLEIARASKIQPQ